MCKLKSDIKVIKKRRKIKKRFSTAEMPRLKTFNRNTCAKFELLIGYYESGIPTWPLFSCCVDVSFWIFQLVKLVKIRI